MATSILGTGSYVPQHIVDNTALAARVGTTKSWISQRTRILERRYAAPGEATSDLALHAARRALAQAHLTAERLDYLILATSTPDSPQPPTSCRIQQRIGATAAACFDINVACSGFVHGLALAMSLAARSPGARTLVVAADVCSRVLDFDDRRTAVLMGDGAGAAVTGPADDEGGGLLDFALASQGTASHLIRVDAGGSRIPASHHTVREGGHFLRMEGRTVANFLLREFPPFLDRFLEHAEVSVDQIDHFVPHQPNGVLLDRLVQHAGLADAHTHRTVRQYGNTGAASVPLTLDSAHRAGLIKAGDLVLLAGFGSGMSMSAVLLRWTGAQP
ncbi:ketoacyl-ACP synthase III [Streptomyces sp. NPDC020707]|uniref:3-oxoacyl-ACP synthase III family protein n=1 Tax=Streptomyces TaxID=1883 RepID=UPI0028D761E5|nr:ketoacyl-ACP synthase III [Streptomyces sp. DSM 40484]